MRFADWAVPSYSDVVFTTGKLTKEDPDLVRRYMRALARGMQYILDHPDETVQLVASYPEQVEDAAKLAWRWKIQNELFVSDDTRTNGLLWMNPQVWEQVMAFYREYDQIPRVLPPAEMMTNEFIAGPNVR
jgi:NitT/TauT family transport system substrate-binding protein